MPAPYSPLTPELQDTILSSLEPETVFTGTHVEQRYQGDASKLRFVPEMVVCPRTITDIQILLRLANRHNFPVSPRGAGSGLAGGCLADKGGVVLSLEKLTDIPLVDPVNGILHAEAGVISQQVKEAAAAHGLFYPPDPAGMDLSTIGGNAATDAGGPACVKYGTTRDYILGLEAVLANGERISTGVQTRKGVVGYDLTNLLVGSEGTLAIITSLWLKLIPKPPAVTSLMCVFASMTDAMQSVTAIMSAGHLPCAIEFLDYRCLELVGDLLPFPLPGTMPSVLIIELDGPAELITGERETIRTLVRAGGATAVLAADDEAQRQNIWEVRRQVSLRIHDYATVYMPEDVAVPISRIAELVEALPRFEQRHGVEIFAFGHAGDGNIHLSVTAHNDADRIKATAAVRELLTSCLEMKGTISGEHGIGLAKKAFLPMELEPVSIDLQRDIKALFDPNNILNPGKIFPDRGSASTFG